MAVIADADLLFAVGEFKETRIRREVVRYADSYASALGIKNASIFSSYSLPRIDELRSPLVGNMHSIKISPFRTSFYTVADPTRLELATSAVTGQRSNQLSYESTAEIIIHYPVRFSKA